MKLIIQSILLALVVMFMVIAVKYFLSLPNNKIKDVVRLTSDKECNLLQSECLYKINNKKLELKLLGDVHTMKPFKVSAQVNNLGSKVEKISVIFSMKSMMMGFNKFKLIKTQDSNTRTEADLWLASILLPVCVNKRTDWEMLIRIETVTKIFEAIIPIEIK